MGDNGVVTADGRLTDWVSLGVLASFVPRDAVDDAIGAAGRKAKRSYGKLPPHVMAYFVMAMALFADDDYEEVAARLTETLVSWGCWDDSWSAPASGGITRARRRLGCEPLKELFGQVAVPVSDEETAGAFLGPWPLMTRTGRRSPRSGWSASASAGRAPWWMPRWAGLRARAPGSRPWPASSTSGWSPAGC